MRDNLITLRRVYSYQGPSRAIFQTNEVIIVLLLSHIWCHFTRSSSRFCVHAHYKDYNPSVHYYIYWLLHCANLSSWFHGMETVLKNSLAIQMSLINTCSCDVDFIYKVIHLWRKMSTINSCHLRRHVLFTNSFTSNFNFYLALILCT